MISRYFMVKWCEQERSPRLTRRAARAGYGPCTDTFYYLISPRPMHSRDGIPADTHGAPARHAPFPEGEAGAELQPRQYRRL
jgi:hypothetical protein